MEQKKTKEYIIETARRNSLNPEHGGRKFLFKKGHISYNKGKKQTEYMSADVIERTKATRFQKGIFPHNGVAIGTESVHDGYIRVKIAMPNIWKFKHVMVWEQYNGKVPSGHNIQFKDGNRENCDINNLYCISRSDQLKNENSMYCKYPKELQLAIQAKGQLTRQINILTQKQ